MNHRFPLLAVVAALALAGCADDAGSPATTTPTGATGGATTTTPPTGSPATTTPPTGGAGGDDDGSGMDDLWGEMPDDYGMTMAFTKDGKETMTMRGAFESATERAFLRITMDPEAFAESGSQDQAQLLADGFYMYMSPEGAYYMIGDAQFVFPQDAEGGFVPSPGESPFGDFIDPESVIGEDGEDGYTVKSQEPTTWKGKPATRYLLETTDEEGRTADVTLVVYDSPRRPAHIETEVPVEMDEETGEPDPFTGGTMTMDLLYDGEIDVEIPAGADRALGLAYASDYMQQMYAGGNEDGSYEEHWTFAGSAGIPLSEIEIQVKEDTEGTAQSDPTGISQLPTLWSMKLSEGTKTQDGVTLTFDDVDGDGAVSNGDVLTVRSEDGQRPTAVLYDTVAQKYVVPGAGLWLVLAALGLLALAFRRRA